MNPWTHAVCWGCWRDNWGTAIPHQVRTAEPEVVNCCFCGILSASGIYVRGDPRDLWCRGLSGVHADREQPQI